jgi:calpain-15
VLAGLSALAESPKRIYDVFITKETNAAHYYSVKILSRGVWREVIFDDYIPMIISRGEEEIAFSCGDDEEIWMMSLEKAWAKLYGSYSMIELGFGEESLHDFTVAPTEAAEFKKTKKTADEKWR